MADGKVIEKLAILKSVKHVGTKSRVKGILWGSSNRSISRGENPAVKQRSVFDDYKYCPGKVP